MLPVAHGVISEMMENCGKADRNTNHTRFRTDYLPDYLYEGPEVLLEEKQYKNLSNLLRKLTAVFLVLRLNLDFCEF